MAEREVTGFRFAADGSSLVGVTTLDAPKGRVVRAALAVAVPSDGWTTLVAEGEAVLGSVTRRRRRASFVRRHDTGDRHRSRRYDVDGPLPRRRRRPW